MSYDFNFLSNVGGSSSASALYTYQTDDLKIVVLAVGYFNDLYLKVKEKDLITIINGIEVYTVRILSVSKNSVVVQKTAFLQREHAEFHLTTTPETVALDDDGVTYTKIPNMVLNIGSAEFSVTTGTLKYLGVGGRFLVNGTSDLEVNKAADVTYALTLNGTQLPSEQTTVSFTASGKKKNISITAIVNLVTGDEIEIQAKGDGTINTEITINKLDTTYLEI